MNGIASVSGLKRQGKKDILIYATGIFSADFDDSNVRNAAKFQVNL
jgi:hypothetical protein